MIGRSLCRNFAHHWLSVYFDVRLSPVSDYSDIRRKCSQSYIIFDIGLTFLGISDLWKNWVFVSIYIFRWHTLMARFQIVLVVGMVPDYFSEYWISDQSNSGEIYIGWVNPIYNIEVQFDIGMKLYWYVKLNIGYRENPNTDALLLNIRHYRIPDSKL